MVIFVVGLGGGRETICVTRNTIHKSTKYFGLCYYSHIY